MELKLKETSRKSSENKKILGRYYITFNFGNDADGEEMAQEFKRICERIGVKRIFTLITTAK